MTKWSRESRTYQNDDQIYADYMDKAGVNKIEHSGLTFFGDARDDLFLKNIRVLNHSYSVGDSLSKISYNYYGDARYWWVLAWFNAKPLDFHCKIGDTIVVPLPLQEALRQAYNRPQEL